MSAEYIARLERKVDQLERELASMRITGKGFSGQGPRGIRFKPDSAAAGAGAAAAQVTISGCLNGVPAYTIVAGIRDWTEI